MLGLNNLINRRISAETLLLAIFLLVTLILISPDLLPAMPDINPHDEAKYIASGQDLVNGEFRELARGPLLGLLYAPIYLIVGQSEDWFMLSAGLGRLILYILILLSIVRLGSRFRDQYSPLITVGLLFISIAPITVLKNPSDALFTAMSTYSLSYVIDYFHFRKSRSIWTASLFVGLAAASRPDGLFLFPFFLGITILLSRDRHLAIRNLVPALIPAVAIFLAFFLAHGLTTGNYSTQVGSKGYNTLEWAQHTISGNSFEDSYSEAEALYGTRSENEGSVFRAILRNPVAFIQRILYNLKILPGTMLSAYSKKVGPAVFLFAFFGVISLLRKKSFMLLIILSLWPLYSALYLGFYLREGFLLLSQFIWILLAGFGLDYAFRPGQSQSNRWIITFVLLGLIVFSFIDNKPAFLAVGVILLSVYTAFCCLDYIPQLNPEERYRLGLLIALCGGAILHDHYPFPLPWEIGNSSEEVAIHYIYENIPHGSTLASSVPLPAIASKMRWVDITSIPGDLDEQAFTDWLQENKVSILYVDPSFIQSQPEDWGLIEESINRTINLELISDPGSIQVFVVNE